MLDFPSTKLTLDKTSSLNFAHRQTEKDVWSHCTDGPKSIRPKLCTTKLLIDPLAQASFLKFQHTITYGNILSTQGDKIAKYFATKQKVFASEMNLVK